MCSTDEQIIATFLSTRSTDAFDQLVTRHLGRIRDLAYRMLLCDSDADDIAQEVFLKVFRNLDSFRGESKFTTWLYRIARNAIRESQRKQTVVREIHGTAVLSSVADGYRPDQHAIDSELASDIEHALAMLSDKLRSSVVLTVMEQLSAKEAASIESCSVATMHWRIHQARKELKRILKVHLKS